MRWREWLAHKLAPGLRTRNTMEVLLTEMFELRKEVAALKRVEQKTTSDAVNLTRENLGLIRLDEKYVVDLDKYDDDSYLRKAKDVLDNPMFSDEVKRIIFEQMHKIALDSPNWESNLIARGTINGVCLLQERLELYNGMYEQRKQQEHEKVERENTF